MENKLVMLDGLLQSKNGKLKCVYINGYPDTLCGYIGKVIKNNKLEPSEDNVMRSYRFIKNVSFLTLVKTKFMCQVEGNEIKAIYLKMNNGKERRK